jgi:hypothetical protein
MDIIRLPYSDFDTVISEDESSVCSGEFAGYLQGEDGLSFASLE